MEKFLLELTGTTDYIMVMAGFVWAVAGMLSNLLFTKKKLNVKEILTNLVVILITMRFTSLIIGSDIFNASIGIVVGFSVEFIKGKILSIFSKNE